MTEQARTNKDGFPEKSEFVNRDIGKYQKAKFW